MYVLPWLNYWFDLIINLAACHYVPITHYDISLILLKLNQGCIIVAFDNRNLVRRKTFQTRKQTHGPGTKLFSRVNFASDELNHGTKKREREKTLKKKDRFISNLIASDLGQGGLIAAMFFCAGAGERNPFRDWYYVVFLTKICGMTTYSNSVVLQK